MAKPFHINMELRGLRQSHSFAGDVFRFLFRHHFGGTWTFLAHTFLKLDRLAFRKSLKTVPLNFREMDKKVFAALGFNEPKPLVFVKLFYRSYCHDKHSPAMEREYTSRKSGACLTSF